MKVVAMASMMLLISSGDAVTQAPYGASEHMRTPAGPVDLYYPRGGSTDVPKRDRGRSYYFEDKRMRPNDYPSRPGTSRFRWYYGTTVERD